MDSWLPIETVPKDGTRVLVVYPNGRMDVDWWEVKELIVNGKTTYRKDGFSGGLGPTYWMPLPEPPVYKQTSSTITRVA